MRGLARDKTIRLGALEFQTKVCNNCSSEKTVDEFYRKKAVCKACTIMDRKRYHEENRAAILERMKRFRLANPQLVADRKKEYHEKNRAHVLAKSAEWRASNPDRVIKWREEHKGYATAWSRANKERLRPIANAAASKRRALTKFASPEVLAIYAESTSDREIRCFWCDHITKQGERHVDHITPLARGGRHVESNLCIACIGCNLKKGTRPSYEFSKTVAPPLWLFEDWPLLPAEFVKTLAGAL